MNVKGTKKKSQVVTANILEQQELLKKWRILSMKVICENITKENVCESIYKVGVPKEEYNGKYSLDLVSMKSHNCCSSYYDTVMLSEIHKKS